jgi:MOSC domain-containing protein YiiM
MNSRDGAMLRADVGIEGNADRSRFRQVTIISSERWRALEAELGAAIDPAARRANLLVTGIDLRESRDRILRVGACRLRILGETRPCERMDEAFDGLRGAMRKDMGGGVYAVVIDSGEIHVGDEVEWAAGATAEGGRTD